MENHFMIDIETTGVDKDRDDILEIGIVEIEKMGPYWRPVKKSYVQDGARVEHTREIRLVLHSDRVPQDKFAREHMTELYLECNAAPVNHDYRWASEKLADWLYADRNGPFYFMGWNASGFDIPFMFKKNILEPSYYSADNELLGDVHYRIYEQTGALQLACDVTGLSRNTVQAIAQEHDPVRSFKLPKGKAHDAIYDCYSQIKMQNGLISLMRNGAKKW